MVLSAWRGIGKRWRFARGSEALEVLAVLEALEMLAAADEDIRPPAVATSATLPLPDFRFPNCICLTVGRRLW